jgi:hypothetical protein
VPFELANERDGTEVQRSIRPGQRPIEIGDDGP